MPLVERRYAQALFELSENELDCVSQEFGDFLNIFNSDKDFSNFLLDPRIKADKKQDAVKAIFDGRLSKNMLNFVLLLISKQRTKNIAEIYEQFLHLVNIKSNILEMKIISAVSLEEQQLQTIKDKFRSKYNASAVKAIETVDPSLIGGVKVIVGDKVYDGSIKGRIQSLTELVNV